MCLAAPRIALGEVGPCGHVAVDIAGPGTPHHLPEMAETSGLPTPRDQVSRAEAELAAADAGYTRVSFVMRDACGVWHGSATRVGGRMPIAVDPDGHVFGH